MRKISAISRSRAAQRRRAASGNCASTTPSTMEASRSALIWSETTSRLSRTWSSASASCCTRAGSMNQPMSSGRSRSGGGSVEQIEREGRALAAAYQS